jgi:ribosomal protein S18 acetylase RimI-like enzyme
MLSAWGSALNMIEIITVDQLDLLAPLWYKLNAFHQDLDELLGNPRRITTWEQRRIQLHEKALGKSLIQILRVDGSSAGYCFTSIDEANKGEIDSLFLLPEWRGRGIGKKLMENALTWLEDLGCKDIDISVHPGNTSAVKFYWSFGFATGPIMKRMTYR